MSQKFLNFLNSLKNQSNQSVIESICAGYQICFESTNDVTLTAYHGSYQNFDKFDLSRIGSARDMGYYSWGFYFTPNIRLAAYYAPIIYTVELHFNNPYITIAAGASDFLSKLDIHLKDYPNSSAEPMKLATEKIKSMGYDGVIIKDSTGSGHIREIVAYDPSQIKILEKKDLRKSVVESMFESEEEPTYKIRFGEDLKNGFKTAELIDIDSDNFEQSLSQAWYSIDFPEKGLLNIEWIKTPEKYQKKGYASQLLKAIQEKHPDKQLRGTVNKQSKNIMKNVGAKI